MPEMLSPHHKFKVVHVGCASFLSSMEDKLNNIKVGFSLLGGKNPLEMSDERACDMYALTHMIINETHTTDDGFDMSMKQYLAFSDGLESYLDNHIFSSIKKHLPTVPDALSWHLQQISLTHIDPKNPNDIATQDPSLITLFSGQLVDFPEAIKTLLSKESNEQFCLLYQAM